MTDELYMKRAIDLAGLGAGNVSPNPMVGAVIAADGKIIGEGWHKRYGGPHAEVNAVESVEDDSLLAKSTMYVTLEPCSHWGTTPPCADMIIRKGIPRVVVGVADPNVKVAGDGIKRMIEAGIEVVAGVLKDECRELNKRFFIFQQSGRPYIILKWAQTSDGYLDAMRPPGIPPAWMTGEQARILVHRWRAEEDAIMVGTNTVVTDNPALTVRSWHGNNPLRVIPDSDLRLDPGCAVFNDEADTLLFTRPENMEQAAGKFAKNPTVEVDSVDFRNDNLSQILSKLADRRVMSLFVEGGAALLGSFIDSDLWDEARIFTSPLSVKELYPSIPFAGGVPAPLIGNAGYRKERHPELGLDILIRNEP